MKFKPCYSVNDVMKEFNKKWAIAGGWAIDLYLDRETRIHSDIEISVLREDQHKLKRYLKEWDISQVVNGELQIWKDEFITLPIHELHAVHKVTNQQLEILLNEKNETEWLFRRDSRIRKPINEISNCSKHDLPYLKPEIVLLYKAKLNTPKDSQDFTQVINHMDEKQKKWLKEAIEIHLPNHKWLIYL